MAEANQNPQEAGDAGQGEQPQGVQQPQPSTEVSKDARMWGMLCHLLGLFTCFIGPLIIWLIKKDEDPFIDDQGKEALNFQITVAIAWIVSAVLVPVFCIGSFLGIAVFIADLVFCILASIKANGGEKYRYPVSIRLIK